MAGHTFPDLDALPLPKARKSHPFGGSSSQKRTKFFDKDVINTARAILLSHGIRIAEEELGCGDYGCAFTVEGDISWVAKITRDTAEARAASRILARPCPGVARFNGVYGLEGVKDGFVIFIERLDEPTPMEKAWIDTTDPANPEMRTGEIYQHARNLFLDVNPPDDGSTWTDIGPLLLARQQLRRRGIHFADSHSGNVRVRLHADGRRELVYIDVGLAGLDPPADVIPTLGLRKRGARGVRESLPTHYRESLRAVEPADIGPRGGNTTVQALLVNKSLFTRKQALQWAEEHGFESIGVEDQANYWRVRLQDSRKFAGFRVQELRPGVKAVYGLAYVTESLFHHQMS